MMKMLMASWSWEPVGGDWTYIDNVSRLYREHGYEVIPFSTYMEEKSPEPPHPYFVKAYDYKKLIRQRSIGAGLKAVKNSVYSREAVRNLKALLDEHEIAFAHVHIIHHWLTPAIIDVLADRNIPVIWSLHEYKLICPEGTMFSHGQICEKCKGGQFYQATLNKCKKGSFLASALASLDAYYYRNKGTYNRVDAFLCPSDFLRRKFQEFGFHPEKLHLSNLAYDIDLVDRFIASNIALQAKAADRPFILYVGRLERNKGIHTLIQAVEGTDIPLKIAGTGGAMEELQQIVSEKGMKNVKFLGFQRKEDVFALTMQCRFAISPSEWYENYPYSVIETLLFSRPVVGSAIGGIPELVVDGETGLLHTMADPASLREKITTLWNNPALCDKLGGQARVHAESRVNFRRHWSILENIIGNFTFKSMNVNSR
jgi:glycosyltransferase involved in cell wall biosynthesis